MKNVVIKGSLSGMFLLCATNLATADNLQFQQTKGMFVHETAEKRLQRLYKEETQEAARSAQENGNSFVPVSYEEWKSKPAGTFEGYPSSY